MTELWIEDSVDFSELANPDRVSQLRGMPFLVAKNGHNQFTSRKVNFLI